MPDIVQDNPMLLIGLAATAALILSAAIAYLKGGQS